MKPPSELTALTLFKIVIFCVLFGAFELVCAAATTCTGQNQVRYGSNCYTFITSSETWENAITACERLEKKKFVSVLSNGLNKFLATQMRNRSIPEMWLGGRSDTTKEWKWIKDSKPLLTYAGCFDDWLGRNLDEGIDNYNEDQNTPQSCIHACMFANYDFAGTEYAKQCFCDHSIDTSFDKKSDNECNMACIGNRHFLCGGGWRIMIYDVRDSFSFWKSSTSEPNYGQREWCAHLSTQDSYFWSDNECTKEFRYMCNIESLLENECINRTHHQYIGDRCLYISPVAKCWYKAREYCIRLGGDLVSLDSKDSMRSVVQQLGNHIQGTYWIGATRRIWKWTNGDPFHWYGWTDGQPSDEHTRCIVMGGTDGLWDDRSCGDSLPFVCQHELPPTTTETITTQVILTTLQDTTASQLPTTNSRTQEMTSAGNIYYSTTHEPYSPYMTTPNATSLSPTKEQKGNVEEPANQGNIGVYVGVSVGGVAFLALIIFALVCLVLRRNRKDSDKSSYDTDKQTYINSAFTHSEDSAYDYGDITYSAINKNMSSNTNSDKTQNAASNKFISQEDVQTYDYAVATKMKNRHVIKNENEMSSEEDISQLYSLPDKRKTNNSDDIPSDSKKTKETANNNRNMSNKDKTEFVENDLYNSNSYDAIENSEECDMFENEIYES